MSTAPAAAPRPGVPDLVALMCESYARLLGNPLAPPGEASAAAWLYREAPFGLLAHDGAEDPRFVYANLVAQRAFERDWDRIVGLPSRLSAEPDAQEDRNRLLAAVRHHDHATGYRGRRIAASGRRFWIEQVTMWNLVDSAGNRHGQAALFLRTSAQ